MGKKSGNASGIRILDEQPGSYFRKLRNNFWELKYLMRIRDPGSKNSDPGWKKFGSGINITDPQHLYDGK
jgi:hypothetical protein